MSSQCIPIQELESLLIPAPGDPRLPHLAECPRCRAELAMLRSFLEGDSNLADDRRQEMLADRMQEVILGKPLGSSDELPRLRRKSRRLDSPVRRSLLAVAAVLLVFLAINRFQGPLTSEDIHLRGGNSRSENGLTLKVESSGDSWLLSWSEIPGADSYQVEILANDLALLDQITISGKQVLEVNQQQLHAWQDESPVLLWRVLAFGGDQLLSRSRPEGLLALAGS